LNYLNFNASLGIPFFIFQRKLVYFSYENRNPLKNIVLLRYSISCSKILEPSLSNLALVARISILSVMCSAVTGFTIIVTDDTLLALRCIPCAARNTDGGSSHGRPDRDWKTERKKSRVNRADRDGIASAAAELPARITWRDD
jgi:hypothetical protein